MGGYGALKVALSRPKAFAAVAAMQPMLEPGLTDAAIVASNRLHHASGGPARLIGPGRQPALFEANKSGQSSAGECRLNSRLGSGHLHGYGR